MAATFRTRPWLLATARPSLSPFSPTMPAFRANMEQTRKYAAAKRADSHFRGAFKHQRRDSTKQQATSSLVKDLMDAQNHSDPSEMAILSPLTIVHIPVFKGLIKWKKEPKKFLSYYWSVARQRLGDRIQILQTTNQLKDKFFSWAKFKASRKGVVEVALSLHADMSQCLAKGGAREKKRLAQICAPKLHRSLLSAIEGRPAGKSYKWEMVKKTGSPFWPRIVDHKWAEMDIGMPVPLSFRQAVVGIKSRQRLVELDSKGKEIGRKEMDLLEYVVLWCKVDKARRTQSDWKIFGTLKQTSYEDLMEEYRLMKDIGGDRAAEQLKQRQQKMEN